MSKKELIRTTAIELFAKKGYYNTTTPMIAEAAQISTGTIYNYFKNKEEILNYIFSVECKKCETFLANLEKADLPVTEKFNSFIDKYYSFLLESPNTNNVLVRYSRCPCNRELEYVDRALHHLPDFFISMLETALEKGEIKEIDPYITGPAIFYTICGMAYSIQNMADAADYSMAFEELRVFLYSALKRN